jgi:hypothetical protein
VPFTEARSHPWTDARASADYRYYDLKAEPSRIRTSLEDFVPWAHYPAIDALYTLIEWLNGEASILESNDCAFTGPHANDLPAFAQPLQCSGRIMVLYRALAENVARHRIESLKDRLHHRLGALDPDLAWGMIGTTIVPVRYVALPSDAQGGHQLMISFWAWGSSEKELMTNLARVVKNLSTALSEDRR